MTRDALAAEAGFPLLRWTLRYAGGYRDTSVRLIAPLAMLRWTIGRAATVGRG
jgi:hypothetical protein